MDELVTVDVLAVLEERAFVSRPKRHARHRSKCVTSFGFLRVIFDSGFWA